jgi:hypothetical protein
MVYLNAWLAHTEEIFVVSAQGNRAQFSSLYFCIKGSVCHYHNRFMCQQQWHIRGLISYIVPLLKINLLVFHLYFNGYAHLLWYKEKMVEFSKEIIGWYKIVSEVDKEINLHIA